MRGFEKEIIDAQLKDEKQVINQLKNLYKDSLKQIDENINGLMARYDATGLQSVIYQLDYQKALKKQINGVLDTLQANEYQTISDYLSKSYQNGFIGTMYSIKKQGIPLVIPMDEEQIINAIVHQSKISGSLYKSLGQDISSLKKRISSEVSRGIANGFSYSEISRNINNTSQIGVNNAVRIARTEGHRIQGQSQLDACYKAKEKGADVVKQWDASLDGRTRKSHRKLDGQIRELDEYFEVDGKKAKTSGQFNRPEEDINCRCCVLQRAKWSLDEDELKTLEERAKYYELDKTEDFNDYKKKYLKAVEEEKKKIPRNYDSNIAKAYGQVRYDDTHDLIDICENQNAVKLWEKYESQIEVADINVKDGAYAKGKKIWVNLDEDALGNDWQNPYQVHFHESGHAIDSLAQYHPSIDNKFAIGKHYSSKYKDGLFPETIVNEVNEMVSKVDKELKELFKQNKNNYDWLLENKFIDKWDYAEIKNRGYVPSFIEIKYKKEYAYKKLSKELMKIPSKARADLSDILEGATSGRIQLGFGHGVKYWRDRTYGGIRDGLATETFAEMLDSTFASNESLEVIKKYLPKSYELFLEMLEILVK